MSTVAQLERKLEEVPPFDKAAEQCIIGAMLIESRAAEIAFQTLNAEDFYEPIHRKAYLCLRELAEAGLELDEVTLGGKLESAGEIHSDVNAFTGKAIMDCPTAANVESYIRIVKDRAADRAALLRASELTQAAKEGRGREALGIDIEKKGPVTIAQWIESDLFQTEVERISTGFPCLDQALEGGFMPGSLYVLAGVTSGGKSALAVNLAYRIPLSGTPTFVNSLEDPPVQVVRKCVAIDAHIPTRCFEKMDFTPIQTSAVRASMQRVKMLKLWVDEIPSLQTLKNKVLAHAAQGVRVFIIDQMSHLQVEARDSFERAAIVSRSMQALAKQSGAVILLVCQINRRGSMADTGPTLYDLRDSGTIEADARGVLLLKSLEVLNPDQQGRGERGILTLEVAKHTFGPRNVTEKFIIFLKEQRIETYAPSHVLEAA